MTVRSAIRLERKRLTDAAIAAEAKLDAIRGKIAALDNALAALDNEEAPKAAPTKGGYTRTYKGRKSQDARKAEVLDAIRKRPNGAAVGAGGLRSEDGIPHASAQKAIAALLAEGRVVKVGETARGYPLVRYKPTTVRPGEEVIA